MKIITLVKALSICGVLGGATGTAVVFSNINTTTSSPYLRVMNKDAYLKLLNDQGINKDETSVKTVSIDYNSLPSSTTSFTDLLEQKNLDGANAFILTVGSEAYAGTNNILKGVNKNYVELNPYEMNSNALMIKLYDLFYNDQSEHHKAVEDFNINFYSFLDIVSTEEVSRAQNLLHERKDILGFRNNNGASFNYKGSNYWKVENPETGIKEERPTVKNSSGSSDNIVFNFEPGNDYYEFLKDDKFETEYEKVYYRNQEEVNLFNTTIEWVNNYASTYLKNFNINKEGSLVAAKYVDGAWTFQSFNAQTDIQSFISFFNPDYENGESGDSENNA